MFISKGLRQWDLTLHLQSKGDNTISVRGHSNLQMAIIRGLFCTQASLCSLHKRPANNPELKLLEQWLQLDLKLDS